MTSVPPTQPPAAPDRLTQAEKSYALIDPSMQWRGRWYSEASVERIVAERVRVVEGERDAARREERMRAEDHANAWREVAIVTARAESAEAAHAALVAELEALCDPANDGPRPYAVPVDGDVLLAVDIDHLRALAGGAR